MRNFKLSARKDSFLIIKNKYEKVNGTNKKDFVLFKTYIIF